MVDAPPCRVTAHSSGGKVALLTQLLAARTQPHVYMGTSLKNMASLRSIYQFKLSLLNVFRAAYENQYESRHS